MKKTFQLLALTMCSILMLNLTLVAQADGEDSIDPPIFPSPSLASVAVYKATSSIEILFFDEAVAAIEVEAESGGRVYQANGKVEKDSQVSINSHRWKGKYTIRVKMNGQLVKQQSINVD